jgi:NADPH:quinone reductase-like Zn-dependent oxidoreductase
MLAAPINPSDLLFVGGQYGLGPKLPAQVGFEGVGTVIQHGGGLLGRFRIGQRVAVIAPQGGTWADYCVTRAEMVLPVPEVLTNQQAAVYFINPATALMLTRWVFQIPLGNWLIQSAANSALGRMVILLGKHFKFRTLNIVRDPTEADELMDLGADWVIVEEGQSSSEDFLRQVDRACSGSRPRFAIDPVGGPVGSKILKALGEQGHMKVIANLSQTSLEISTSEILERNLRIEGFLLNREIEKLALRDKLRFVKELAELHRGGFFDVEVFQSRPLSQWTAAIQAAQESSGGTKQLLQTITSGHA